MTQIAVRLVVLAALTACGGNPSRWTEADAGPAPAPPGALILSAGGSLAGGPYRLEAQVGQVVVPQPAGAGDTTVTPDNPIDR
jgi:hypothetical protein